MPEHLIATLGGHHCLVIKHALSQPTRYVHGFEQIGEPFECPTCGVRHEFNREQWSNIKNEDASDEYGESFQVLVCDGCDSSFKPPTRPHTWLVYGQAEYHITVTGLPFETSKGVVKPLELICHGNRLLDGQYIMQEWRDGTAKLIGHPKIKTDGMDH